MELVVDASVLFAAIIGKSKTSELFFVDELHLIASPYLIDEFEKNIGTLAAITGLSVPEVREAFEILKTRLTLLPAFSFSDSIMAQAQKIAPHSKDVPYFAMALFLNSGIWSRERYFKKQDAVSVYLTEDLVKMFLERK